MPIWQYKCYYGTIKANLAVKIGRVDLDEVL
jgi:hypothetical protein